jgi:prepilin-type N-terminal cleavage/methylation domain-containing protein
MQKGFTLAEVLVTIGILGVIAALTIPSVVKNYRYKVYSTQLQKAYSQIQTAIKTVMEDEMTNDFYQTTAGMKTVSGSCTVGPCYFLTKYFKTARTNCGNTTPKCYASSYKSINGDDAGTFLGDYCIQTINGATICVANNATNLVTSIFLDVNGAEEPNITGLDTFVLDFTSDGRLKDWNSNASKCNTQSTSYGHVADYASGCLTKVMNNGWKIEE